MRDQIKANKWAVCTEKSHLLPGQLYYIVPSPDIISSTIHISVPSPPPTRAYAERGEEIALVLPSMSSLNVTRY